MPMNPNAAAALAKAREARKAQAQAGAPRISRRKAIKEKCIDCAHDPLAGGTWLSAVDGCTDESCALWPVRPRRKAKP